jgi:hypothetical protein
MENRKVYVKVTASFSSDGDLTPLSVTWEDGCEYIIDRVLDVRPAAAMKAGGRGTAIPSGSAADRAFCFSSAV